MDYTRATLFITKNNFTKEQIDEFIAILQDIQHQAINEYNTKFCKILEQKIK